MHKTINGFYLNDINFNSDIDDKNFTHVEILELFKYLTTHNHLYKIEKYEYLHDLDDTECLIDTIENKKGYQAILKNDLIYFEDSNSSEEYYITDIAIINIDELENRIRVHDLHDKDIIYYFYFSSVII